MTQHDMREADGRAFDTAEAAWFWTVRALHTSAGSTPARVLDVVKCLDTLYRQRRIELIHARILRIWGARGVAPNPGRPRERSDWRLWREALGQLEPRLRARGLVRNRELPDAAD